MPKNPLYTLRVEKHVDPSILPLSCTYVGTVLAAGPDAAIEIVDGDIKLYLDGTPCSPDTDFGSLAARYDRSIRQAAIRRDTKHMAICGKWHAPTGSQPLFIPYLVREFLTTAPQLRLSPYDLEIFDYDDLENGSDMRCVLRSCADICRPLHIMAKATIDRVSDFLPEGEACPIEGVLWFPQDTGAGHPVVVSRASEWAYLRAA